MSVESLEKAAGRKFTASELLHMKLFHVQGGSVMRVVYGPLAGAIDIDYANLPLSKLRELIEFALLTMKRSKPELFNGKKILVYEGGNHLDVINDGVGSMGWLIVEDHLR